MLEILVRSTGSAYGFLDEVLLGPDGRWVKRRLALLDIASEAPGGDLLDDLETERAELQELDALAGAPVVERRLVIANDVLHDPRFRGCAENDPPITRFLGIPLLAGDEVIGVVGVANRSDDYAEDVVTSIQPLPRACTAMIRASRAEAALVESERKWRNILVETPQIGVSLDSEGRIVFANAHLLELTGWSEDEVLGGNWFELFVPKAIRAQVFEFFLSVVASDPSVAITSYENEIVTRSGELRNVAWSNVVTRDARGAFVDVTCLGVDLTEHRRAIDKLRESEERYRLLVENANELVLIAQDGRFAFVNRKAIGLLGYTPEELEGTPFADHIHPEDRARVVDNHLKRLAGEQLPEVYSFRILHRSGEVRWVEIGAVVVEWQGRPATLNFLLDVTDRKRAEDERERLQAQLLQAQKMESVGRLAGGVAHDFNNMLGVILARSELALMESAPDDPRTEDLVEIHAAASRSAELTRQLLAFARKQTISPQLLDLNDAVEGLLTMLRRLIGEDVELVWRPGAGLDPVEVDPAQLDHAVTNLCVNARDAISGAGTITIATGAEELDEADCASIPEASPGRYAALSVADDGCGMTEEVQSHLFEPFFTTKGTGVGTGLGLATVFGIVRQSGGLVRVDSEVARGSTFTILLPCREGTVDGGPAPARQPPRATAGETVLLAEDNPAILAVGRKLLERLGFTVLTASTADEALAVAGDDAIPIHLLLTDVVMPQISGRELADRVAELRPGIAVLFMSGYTADIIARNGVLDEGAHFIQKPFSMAELAAKVREVLDPDD